MNEDIVTILAVGDTVSRRQYALLSSACESDRPLEGIGTVPEGYQLFRNLVHPNLAKTPR